MLFISVRSSNLGIVFCREDLKSGFLKTASNAAFLLDTCVGTCSFLGMLEFVMFTIGIIIKIIKIINLLVQ